LREERKLLKTGILTKNMIEVKEAARGKFEHMAWSRPIIIREYLTSCLPQ